MHSLHDIASLNIDTLRSLLRRARENNFKEDTLKKITVGNLFCELSTRTQVSFEVATLDLGGRVINLDPTTLAFKKGEDLAETIRVLELIGIQILVLRHSQDNISHILGKECPGIAIINAGDGCRAHPTQALIDALVMEEHFGDIKGLKVAIVGDTAHSRVARSNVACLTMLGAQVIIVSPDDLLLDVSEYPNATSTTSLQEGIQDADIIMALRIQNERLPSQYDKEKYITQYQITKKVLKKNTLLMHPGPVNYGIEIAEELRNDTRNKIHDQVAAGVKVRKAVLEAINKSHSV